MSSEQEKRQTDRDVWKERQNLYLEDAKRRISGTRTALLIWIAALLTSWLSGIEQSAENIRSYLQAKIKETEAKGRVDLYSKSEAIEQKAARTPQQSNETIRTASDTDFQLPNDQLSLVAPIASRRSEDWISKAESKYEKLSEKLEEQAAKAISFKLFDVEMPLPPLIGPSVWLILLFLMLLSATVARYCIFKSLSRAVRIEREHLQADTHERIIDFPWWLAPLPAETGKRTVVSRKSLLTVVGWNNQPLRCKVFQVMGIALLALIVLEMLSLNNYLLHSVPQLKLGLNDTVPGWQLGFARVVPPIAIAFCCILVLFWFWPFGMPDHFSQESAAPIMSRRHVFTSVCILCVSGVLVGFRFGWLGKRQPASRNKDRHKLLAKLERIRMRRLTPIHGLTQNKIYRSHRRTQSVLHITNSYGAFRFPAPPKLQTNTPVELDFSKFEPTLKGERLAFREASFALEMKALDMLDIQKDLNAACDILLCAARHDLLFFERDSRRPSFRLYDLLAGLSVRAKSDHLKVLFQLLSSSPALPLFHSRVAKWSKPDSRWRKGWHDKDREWQISVAAPKRAKDETKDFKAESEKRRVRLPT